MIRRVKIIAIETMHEILRERILVLFVAFGLLMICLSLAVGQLSFVESARITMNFGLSGLQIALNLITLFVGGSLIWQELEKRTVLTVLTHSVTRTEFILGKYFGMALVLLILASALSLVLFAVGWLTHFEFLHQLPKVIWGFYIEALVVLAMLFLFSSFARPMLTVTATMGLVFIGHWQSDLAFFSEKSESASFQALAKFISWVVPNLERYNWKSEMIYDEYANLQNVLMASANAFFWICILLTFSTLLFRRRDLI